MLTNGTKRLVVSLDRLRDHNVEETTRYIPQLMSKRT